jgi:acetyltransferase
MASGQRVMLRPIRPEDEPAHREFLSELTPEDNRFRFFGKVKELSHEEMAHYVNIDYDTEMAFIACTKNEDGACAHVTLGVVRVIIDAQGETAEFAIVVRSDVHHQGLGWKLMDKMTGYCRSRGLKTLTGEVLSENHRMLSLMRDLGFKKHIDMEDRVARVFLAL